MTSTRFPAIGIVGALALLATPPAAAQSQTVAQIRAVCVRFACTPSQFREVSAFIDSNAARITDLARTNRVNQTAFRAIAIELGVRYRASDPQALLRAIEARVADAVRFERENATLRQQLVAVADRAIRTPAEALLARADAAYQAGDLDGAQAAFDELLDLRSSELNQVADAWESANRSAFNLASAAGDTGRLERLVTRAAAARTARRLRQAAADRHNGWLDAMALADSYAFRGGTFGDQDALSRALATYNNALTLAPLALARRDRSITLLQIGNTLNQRGNVRGSSQDLFDSINSLMQALTAEGLPNNDNIENIAAIQMSLGASEARLGSMNRDSRLMTSAISRFHAAQQVFGTSGMINLLGQAGVNEGLAYYNLYSITGNHANLIEARRLLESSIVNISRTENSNLWGLGQNSLGVILRGLGNDTRDRRFFVQALNAYGRALEVQSETEAPIAWAQTHLNIANVMIDDAELAGEISSGEYDIIKSHLSNSSRIFRGTVRRLYLISLLQEIKIGGMWASTLRDSQSLLESWNKLTSLHADLRPSDGDDIVRLADEAAVYFVRIATARHWTLPDMRSQGGYVGTAMR